MHDPPESYDLIQLNYATYVWIDHCDLSTEGLTGDKDYYDGLLDITHVGRLLLTIISSDVLPLMNCSIHRLVIS